MLKLSYYIVFDVINRNPHHVYPDIEGFVDVVVPHGASATDIHNAIMQEQYKNKYKYEKCLLKITSYTLLAQQEVQNEAKSPLDYALQKFLHQHLEKGSEAKFLYFKDVGNMVEVHYKTEVDTILTTTWKDILFIIAQFVQ